MSKLPDFEQTLGKFPISIATSLALEGLFSIHDENPNTGVDLYKDFHVLAINVQCLVRNAINSYTSEQIQSLEPTHVFNIVKQELNTIPSVIKGQGANKLKVFYYLPLYKGLNKLFSKAKLRTPNTAKQQHMFALHHDTLNALVDNIGNTISVYQKQPNLPKQFSSQNLLYLTHQPVDFLYVPNGSYQLLESHTGRIKTKRELNTKIGVSTDDRNKIPFDRMTLQMYGDKGTMFLPQSATFRRKLIEVAVRYNWNPTTTQEKIKENCKMFGDSQLTQTVLGLYRN